MSNTEDQGYFSPDAGVLGIQERLIDCTFGDLPVPRSHDVVVLIADLVYVANLAGRSDIAESLSPSPRRLKEGLRRLDAALDAICNGDLGPIWLHAGRPADTFITDIAKDTAGLLAQDLNGGESNQQQGWRDRLVRLTGNLANEAGLANPIPKPPIEKNILEILQVILGRDLEPTEVAKLRMHLSHLPVAPRNYIPSEELDGMLGSLRAEHSRCSGGGSEMEAARFAKLFSAEPLSVRGLIRAYSARCAESTLRTSLHVQAKEFEAVLLGKPNNHSD